MVTGNEILNYQGNVGLGLNTSGIAEYGETDTKDLSNAVFNMAYINLQKNKDVWQQKLKDRDEGMKLIAAGELEINNALPKHREELIRMIEGVKDIYYKNGGDVKSDPSVWLDINDKLAKFKTSNRVAKTNLLTYTEGMAVAAEERNPILKKKMQQHFDKEKEEKGVNQLIDPYQQTMTWDPAKVFVDLPTKPSTSYRSGDNDVTETITDAAKGWLDFSNLYNFDDNAGAAAAQGSQAAVKDPTPTSKAVANVAKLEKGETAQNMNAWFEDAYGITGNRSQKVIDETTALTNAKLMKIAQLEGYKVDTPADIRALPEYLKPIILAPDPLDIGPDGKPRIKPVDTVPLTVYKTNLALKYQNGKTSKLNKDYSAIDKTKADTAASRALANQRNTAAGLNRAKTKFTNSKTGQVDESKLNNFFDDALARRQPAYKTITTKDPVTGKPVTKRQNYEVIWKKNMPEGLPEVMSGAGSDGTPIPSKPFTNKAGDEYWIVGKSPFYIGPTGKRVTETYLKDYYKTTKAELLKKGVKSYEELLTYLEDQGYKQDEEMVGENGPATRQTTKHGITQMNNKSKSSKIDADITTEGENLDQ